MASYRVTVKQSVAKDLLRIPKKEATKVLQRIRGLTGDTRPHGAEKLSRREKYRIRQGIYRIVYEIKPEELVVVAVKFDHRHRSAKNG